MDIQECLIQENTLAITHLIPFEGRELVVIQEDANESESKRFYVIVPGFKAGGPHTSSFSSKRQAYDVEPVGNANRGAIIELLEERKFLGPINFWS